LLAVGTDEEDLAGSDAVVDPDLVCSYVVTCFVSGFPGGVGELGPDATMADRNVRHQANPTIPKDASLRNMRTRGTCVTWWPGGDADHVHHVRCGQFPLPAVPVVTGFPARIHG
jgi:hypothetical protein